MDISFIYSSCMNNIFSLSYLCAAFAKNMKIQKYIVRNALWKHLPPGVLYSSVKKDFTVFANLVSISNIKEIFLQIKSCNGAIQIKKQFNIPKSDAYIRSMKATFQRNVSLILTDTHGLHRTLYETF